MSSKSPRYAMFVHLRALPSWLALPRARRRTLAGRHLGGALARHPAVAVRHFDAEAFSADCSDVMLAESGDPLAYYHFMEDLRDSPLLAVPYFEVVRIVPAIEDGYLGYEAVRGRAAGKGG